MNRPASLVYLIVTLSCVLLALALALADAGQALPGHPQPANPAWPDALQIG